MIITKWKFTSIPLFLIVVSLVLLSGCAKGQSEGPKQEQAQGASTKVYKLKCSSVLGPGTGIWKAGTEWA